MRHAISAAFAITLCGLAIAPAAATPERFDLTCRLHPISRTNADRPPTESDEKRRYSIDVTHRRWCPHTAVGPCVMVINLHPAGGDKLRLLGGVGKFGTRLEIDLATGAYDELTRRPRVGTSPETTQRVTGHCTLVPFTPGAFQIH